MVTHGDNGTFWSVVQKGEEGAASDLGVTVNYQGSNNDDTQECQLISAAVTAKPDGLVVSPHSQTVLDCAKSAAAGGLPLILINNVVQARERGLGVIFITHNPHHAYPVGDRFVLLNRGRLMGSFAKSETTLADLTQMMAGGEELERLSRELEKMATGPELEQVARELAEEAGGKPA